MRNLPSTNHKRKLVLFPLLDVFFILLVSYLFIEQWQPTAVPVDVPEQTGMGEVNAVVQILDEGNYVWIDSSFVNSFGQDQYELTGESLTEFLSDVRTDMGQFNRQLSELDLSMREQGLHTYSVVLRCPNTLDFWVVSNMLQSVDSLKDMSQESYELKLSVLGGGPSTMSVSRGIQNGREYVRLDF